MKGNNKNENGITLIALVVTIILLLILSGVAIRWVTSGNSIIEYADASKRETKKGQIIDYLSVSFIDEQTAGYDKNIETVVRNTQKKVKSNGKSDLSAIAKEVEVKDVGKNTINEKDEEYFFYVIVDGDVYKVGAYGAKYLGKKADIENESLGGNIGFDYSETTWTRNNVTVTATTDSLYTIEISTDLNTWEKTNSKILQDNGKIYARLVDSAGNVIGKEYETAEVKIIDRQAPEVTLTGTVNGKTSVTLNGTGTDALCNISYGWSADKNTQPTEWTPLNAKSGSGNLTVTTSQCFWIKDEAGNTACKLATLSQHKHSSSCTGYCGGSYDYRTDTGTQHQPACNWGELYVTYCSRCGTYLGTQCIVCSQGKTHDAERKCNISEDFTYTIS